MESRKQFIDASLWLHSCGTMLNLYARTNTKEYLAFAVNDLHRAVLVLGQAVYEAPDA